MSSFVDRYKQDWTELERLVQRGRKWRSGLTSVERQRLDELYRRTTIHLARVMTAANDPALAEYLNGLTAAAHSLIYLPPRDSLLRKLRRYVSEGFPRAVARTWKQHAISAALVVGGGLIGYFAASADPVVAHALWPAEDARQPGSKPEQLLSVLRSGRKEGGGEKFIFASFLFQHNLKVSLLAMASGVLAAAPTVLLMIFNGMLLGVFVAIHHEAGIRAEMWAWILPHGITEFGAIILCGGVGLLLGRAVVRPGALSRGESLLLAGREAGRICAGTAAMLVLAAIIESYVRQSHWTTGARLVFAGGTAMFWAAYLLYGFLRERQETAEPVRSRTLALSADNIGRGALAPGFETNPKADYAAVVQRID